MDKHVLIVGVALLFLTIGLSGCIDNRSSSELDRFIGKWQTAEGVTLILSSDETCSFIGGTGTWEVKDGKLLITIRYEDGQNMMSYDYQFSDNDKTLTLIDAGNRLMVFTKQ